MELYGAQQQLANLQMALEKAQENYEQVATTRQKAEEEVQRMRTLAEKQTVMTKEEERRCSGVREAAWAAAGVVGGAANVLFPAPLRAGSTPTSGSWTVWR